MQPQRPLLVPHCSPRAQLGLPAERQALKAALLQPLAAPCRPLPLPRSCPRPLPPPHTANSLLPSLRDCAGRSTLPLAAAGPTSSAFPTSVSKLPGSVSPHSENQSPYVCTARSKEVATPGKDTSLFPGGSLEHRLAGGVAKKSTSSRPWAQIGSPTATLSPPHTPPPPLKPSCPPHLSTSPALPLTPPQPTPSPSPCSCKRTHPTHPPPQALACSFFCFFQRE